MTVQFCSKTRYTSLEQRNNFFFLFCRITVFGHGWPGWNRLQLGNVRPTFSSLRLSAPELLKTYYGLLFFRKFSLISAPRVLEMFCVRAKKHNHKFKINSKYKIKDFFYRNTPVLLTAITGCLLACNQFSPGSEPPEI